MLRTGVRCCGMRRRRDRAAPIRDLGGAVALLVVATLVPAAGASASATLTLTGPEFVQLLRSGQALTGVSVEGDVRLGRATLRRRSTCRDCSFAGDVIAVRATFEQPLDLDGSTFAGKVELTGARLKRGLSAHGAVFRGIVDLRHAQVTGSTDLSEATFQEPMLMGGGPEAPSPAAGRCAAVDFCGDVGFFLARFASLADFDGTVFRDLDSGWRASRATRSSPRPKPTRRRSGGRPSSASATSARSRSTARPRSKGQSSTGRRTSGW